VPSTTSPLLFQTKIHEFSSLNIKHGRFQDFLAKKWIFEASPNRRLSKNPSTQAILPPEHCSHRFVATATVNAMEKANLWNLGRKTTWGRWNLYDFLPNTYKVGQYDRYKWSYGPPTNGLTNGVATLIVGVITPGATLHTCKIGLQDVQITSLRKDGQKHLGKNLSPEDFLKAVDNNSPKLD